MPIYMDRHDLDSVTAKDVADVHQEDIKIQDEYNCKGLTYWFDEKRRAAFCLIEAPDKKSVHCMHDHAHGLVPHRIIEVESSVVNAFLGRITDPQSESDHPINESPYRIIMYISFKEMNRLKMIIDRWSTNLIINSTRDIVQNAINLHNGREVVKDNNRLIISFTSAVSALDCALEIQNKVSELKEVKENHNIKIGLSAGEPVTNREELFGETVNQAKRLSEIANQNLTMISSAVHEAYNNENLAELPDEKQLQVLSPADDDFVNNLMETTEKLWNDPQLDVGEFGKQLGLSKSQFYRRITTLTGISPNDFIRDYRLKKAFDLIRQNKGNITQIAFETGFNSPSYFSKCFQKRFGLLPSKMA